MPQKKVAAKGETRNVFPNKKFKFEQRCARNLKIKQFGFLEGKEVFSFFCVGFFHL